MTGLESTEEVTSSNLRVLAETAAEEATTVANSIAD